MSFLTSLLPCHLSALANWLIAGFSKWIRKICTFLAMVLSNTVTSGFPFERAIVGNRPRADEKDAADPECEDKLRCSQNLWSQTLRSIT